MAGTEKIINNPSITSGNFTINDGKIVAISDIPIAGGGGGTQSDFVYVPSFNSETGDLTFNLGVTGSEGKGPWHISGATGPQGEQGIQGEPGPAGANGKTPELRINPSNAEWQWKYSGDANWTDLGVIASGAVGPQGQSGASGASGASGISPTVTTAAIPGEDGTRVTFIYGPGGDSTYIDVMNGAAGASGASGESGYSPTITTATTADAQHPQSGVNVTVTDINGNQSFNIWNGIDGQGATVNLLEGDGIQITHNGTDYTIGVSADYALKSDLPDVSDMATQTWVGQQNYLTSVPSEYITESELSTTLADYMQSVLTGAGLSGNGSTTALGIDTTAAINFTNASAKSATSAASAASAYHAQYFTYGNTTYPIATYAEMTELAIDSLHATEPGYREEELDEPPLIAEYAASAYLGPNTYLGFDKFVTSGSNISGDKQYVLTSGGWQEVQGGLTSVSANSPISGNGTTNQPLGIDSDNFYELDTAGNYLTSQTSDQKTIINTTPALDNAVDRVITSADVWDTVSAKSVVTVNSANNEIKVNNNSNSAISATTYDICNTSEPTLIPQRLIVGTSSGDFVTYVNGGECEGQGTLFFWLESMQPWVPVNN